MKDLDSIDWNILKALQENARLTYRELSRIVNLTPPAVSERVLKLEENGVVAGYHAAVDLYALGIAKLNFLAFVIKAADIWTEYQVRGCGELALYRHRVVCVAVRTGRG